MLPSSSHGSSEDICEDCEAGKFAEQGSATCSICSAGKYYSSITTPCISCPSGKYITDDATDISLHTSISSCVDCEAGKFAAEQGSATCSICPFGTYYSSVTTPCISCPSGKYITDDATDISLHVSVDSCVDCDAGKSSNPPASSCPITCPIGTHSPPGSPCLDCEAGKFNENVQQESCTNCGTGRYSLSATAGATVESVCRNCEAGKASSEEVRTTPCPACVEGKSAPAPGLDSCPSCPAGTYSDSPAAILCDLCAIGKYTGAAQSTSCDDCVAGTFNLVEGSVTCDKCPAGQRMNDAGNDCEVCPDGTYSNPGSLSCTDCDHTSGYVSLAGDSGADKCEYCGPGFYADQTSHTCKECEIDSYSLGGVYECTSCPSGTNNAKASTTCSPCSPGTIPTGSSCDQCEKGKYGVFGATSCSDCTGEGQYSSSDGAVFCSIVPAGYRPNTAHDGYEKCSPGRYSLGAATECLACPDGAISTSSNTGCIAKCNPGEVPISGDSGDSECVKCEKGKYASYGGGTCLPCNGPGEYADEIGSPICKTAPAGTIPTSNREDIEQCPRNTFSIGAADECTVCANGGHSKPGSPACEICLSGKYYDEPSNECKLCPKNTFTISGATDINGCEDCPAGGHSQPGSGYCDQCRSGKYYEEQNNSCELCPAGKYTATGGESIDECLSCDDGFYSYSPGASNCLTCEPGKYTNTEQTECLLCPAGKISGVAAGECTVCEIGKFAESEGSVECKFCNTEEVVKGSITAESGTTSRSSCICPVRKYLNNETSTCDTVPEGVKDTVEGMNVTTMNLEMGFWRTASDSSVILRCLAEDHCLGGPDPEDQCKEGHTGPLCAVCEDGYASTGSGLTLKCNVCEGGDATQTIAVYLGLFTITVSLAASLACCCGGRKPDQEDEDDDGINLTSADSLAAKNRSKRGQSLALAERAIKKTNGIMSTMAEVQPFIKIMFSYYQIVGGMSWGFDLNFPPIFTNFLSFTSSIVNLDFLNLMPLGCVTTSDFHRTLVVMTLGPFTLGLLNLLLYKAFKTCGKKHRSHETFGWFLFMTFLVLPSVATKIFSTFACRDFDGDYGSYLKVDYSIDCDSAEHKKYVTYACACCAVFPIGVPLMYFFLLRRVKSLLDPGQKQLCFSKGEEEGLKAALEERERLEQEHEDLASLSFLYSAYEPECWYFEIVETMRKLVLTGGLIFLGPGTSEQIAISMIICLGAIRIFSGFKPYVKQSHDSFSEVSQWQVFFVMLSAMMIKTKLDVGETSSEQAKTQTFYDVCLVGIQFMSPLLLVGILLKRGEIAVAKKKRKKKEKKEKKKKNTRTAEGDKEGGLGLELVERGEGGTNQIYLGGGDGPFPRANAGRPNSSFDAFKNKNLVVGGRGKVSSEKISEKAVSKGPSAAQKRSQFVKTSSVSSSFSANEDVWIEHNCEEDGRKGETYYHQPSTGKTVWERPGEGASIKLAERVGGREGGGKGGQGGGE
ncbi:hypothetical protein TrST_g1107 [Triparma strigata]|uniref:Tyrosine-protein kinase ephrin type A/B receptor-like domain-containing protein n=1 Tax=Triparma strigata TaxID=1606541 RepID=A0A9W7E7W4_9STRA|nr:hypothetical protein TrST_g1107 [Triparma strigata]